MSQTDPRSAVADARLESGAGQPIQFEENDVGLSVIDRVEQCRRVLRTRPGVSPRRTAPSAVGAPVDAAVRVSVESIAFGDLRVVDVRHPGGATIATVAEAADERFPPDEYLIDVPGPIKLYVQVEGEFAVESTTETTITFPAETTVAVGARSHHERPAATVTTTTDVEDVMAAISTFGSALKTTSPERAWPTMRGHPPAVEIGDALDVPAGVEPPADDVRIVVPPALEHAYVTAPLSFYLGAPLVPGSPARIETDEGTVFRLDAGEGSAARSERALQQALLLDCLVRTEGLAQYPLHERAALESRLDLDFARLYDRPLEARLEQYFQVPFDELAPFVPNWEVASYVAPAAEHVSILPYLLDDLSVIRTDPTEATTSEPVDSAFAPDDTDSSSGSDGAGAIAEFTRSGGATAAPPDDVEYVKVGDGSAIDEPWVGEGMPIGGSKASERAMQNRLDRTPSEPPISVTLVCNDEEMAEEFDEVKGPYGTEDSLPFEVSVYRDLSSAALATAIETAGDFLHYIGHADEAGFRCRDGPLDLASVRGVAPDAFLLNACRSYDQAMALIEEGAIGGVATISPIPNPCALTAGRTLARLLNFGFPLRAAVHVARTESIIDGEYVIVGDGGHAIAQRNGTTAPVYDVQTTDNGSVRLRMTGYPSARASLGSVFHPYLEQADYYLVGNRTPAFELPRDEFVEFASTLRAPTRVEGELHWRFQTVLDAI